MQVITTVAYIDPGAGAMVLQWLIAAVLGGGIFFRRAIGRFFGRLFGKKAKEEGEKEEGEKEEGEKEEGEKEEEGKEKGKETGN